MNQTKEKPAITIIGKRWFDGTNTYHSVGVWVDGELVGSESFAYGYDDQYIQTAFEILQKEGVYPKTGERKNGCCADWLKFQDDRRNHRDRFIFSVSDVGRKKDL